MMHGKAWAEKVLMMFTRGLDWVTLAGVTGSTVRRGARIVLKTVVPCILALAVAALALPGRAQEDPGFVALAFLAETDPAAALVQIDAQLAREAAQPAPDPRVVFDHYRLQADLLIGLGRMAEAAALLADLALYTRQMRARLDLDPAPLFDEAARLFEAAGDPARAREVMLELLAEHREGARPADVIAGDLARLARLSDLLGEAETARSYRDAAQAALAAPADPVTRGDNPGFREVDVYYATDRARSGEDDPNTFYGADRGALELGIATVSIPETHTPGVVEAPSIWRLEFRADPAKHVVLQRITPLAEQAFYSRLQSVFADAPGKEAFVFVHGYNVRFDQAARRAAQMAYDMNYDGVPILYSWPSRGSTVGYVADTAVVRLSGRRLSRFLDDLVARSGAETIHIVAHSMGNRALTDALELLALRHGLQPGDAPVFGQVIFAAPDVDAGLFKAMLPTIRPVARRLTLYASEEDWALTASRKLHGDMPRAGIGGATTLSDAHIDSIDMSELGEDMLSHSYFADDSSALADLMTLFWRNAAPQHRCGLESRAALAGEVPVWAYRRDTCAERSLIGVLGHLKREGVQSEEAARAVVRRTVSDRDLAARLERVVSAMVGD